MSPRAFACHCRRLRRARSSGEPRARARRCPSDRRPRRESRVELGEGIAAISARSSSAAVSSMARSSSSGGASSRSRGRSLQRPSVVGVRDLHLVAAHGASSARCRSAWIVRSEARALLLRVVDLGFERREHERPRGRWRRALQLGHDEARAGASGDDVVGGARRIRRRGRRGLRGVGGSTRPASSLATAVGDEPGTMFPRNQKTFGCALRVPPLATTDRTPRRIAVCAMSSASSTRTCAACRYANSVSRFDSAAQSCARAGRRTGLADRCSCPGGSWRGRNVVSMRRMAPMRRSERGDLPPILVTPEIRMGHRDDRGRHAEIRVGATTDSWSSRRNPQWHHDESWCVTWNFA